MTHAGDANRYIKAAPFQINFDWTDAVTNTGYKRYYPCAASEDGGTIYFITTQVIDARPVLTQSAANGDAPELNFDLEPFKVPVTLRGRAVINSTLLTASGGQNYLTKFLVYHVSIGAAETQIGAENTATHSPGAGGKYYRDCVEIAITETDFAIGEKLRLAVTTNADGAVNRSIHHDPATSITVTDTDVARTVGTDMTFDVPFKLIE